MNNNDIYKILKDEHNSLDKIIRHYKIIKKKINDEYSKNEYDKSSFYVSDTDNKTYIINSFNTYQVKEISQDPDNYNNIYNDDGFNSINIYRDDKIEFNRYKSVEELQNKLDNDEISVNIDYVEDLNKSYEELDNSDFGETIKNIINNYNDNLYIRFAPSKDIRKDQIKLILANRNTYTKYNDDEFINAIIENEKIPIFNDNLVYSESKCNYVNKQFNEKFNTNIEL